MPKTTPPITQIFPDAPTISLATTKPSSSIPLPPSLPSLSTFSDPLTSARVRRIKPRAHLKKTARGELIRPAGAVCSHPVLKEASLERLMDLIRGTTNAISDDAKAWMYQGVFRLSGSESRKNDCIARLLRAKNPEQLMTDFINEANPGDAVPVLKTLLLSFRDAATPPPELIDLAQFAQAEEKRSQQVAEILSEEDPVTFEKLASLASAIIEHSHITRGHSALKNGCRLMYEIHTLKKELEKERKANQACLASDSPWAPDNFLGVAYRRGKIRKMTEQV